ncbi:MAG: hypothetical protein L3J19_08400 [Sulfurimonas sp.]|nr:hypothetical protein [Sulfurimonas sp.]
MSLRIISFMLYLLFIANAVADTNATFQDYIDEKQKNISKKVVDWSYNIDQGLSRWIYNADDETYCEEKEDKLNDKLFEDKDDSIDEFFKSDKFIDETIKRFVSLRLYSNFQSKESTTFNYKIRLHVPLTKTTKNIQLFIDNVEEDYFTDTTANDNNEEPPNVGVSYFSEDYHKIKSKYSIGTRGLNPYVRARYYRVFESGKWTIEPAQQFKYSLKYEWQEETYLYFDRRLNESSLFRTALSRGTRANVDGMNYGLGFTYYHTAKRDAGLSLSQSFSGNTKYRTIDKPDSYSGISNYQTAASWRQSIWRKWFVYEVQPAISFHRQYDYEPNYILNFNVELYFGNI